LEHTVIRTTASSAKLAVSDEPEHFDERKLMLGIVDLAAKQRDACAILLSFMDKLDAS